VGVIAVRYCLERVCVYVLKHTNDTQCLGDAAAAEERATKMEVELEDLKGHLQRLLDQLALRDMV
jgi:hypothetical protein